MSEPKDCPAFVEVKLSKPFVVNGVSMLTLRLREPTAGDQKIAIRTPGTDKDREAVLFANLLEVSVSDIDRLPLRDIQRISKAFDTNFFD